MAIPGLSRKKEHQRTEQSGFSGQLEEVSTATSSMAAGEDQVEYLSTVKAIAQIKETFDKIGEVNQKTGNDPAQAKLLEQCRDTLGKIEADYYSGQEHRQDVTETPSPSNS